MNRAGENMLRRAVLLVLGLCVPAEAFAQQEPPDTQFLVAKPGMRDPNFREAVVLVTQDELGQAVGVIVNRPTDRSLAELLPGERFKNFTEPVFFGGPVGANGLFAVFRSRETPAKAITLLPGLYLALNPDTIDALLGKPPQKIRFFSGYAGWAPGQLRAEIERGDWLVLDADADAVFRKDTSKLWEEMLRRASAIRADAEPPYGCVRNPMLCMMRPSSASSFAIN
jgi:putative transcriptional regulator